MCTSVIEADFVQKATTFREEQSLLLHEICRNAATNSTPKNFFPLKEFNPHVSIRYNPNPPPAPPLHFFACSWSASIASLVSFCSPSISCSASVISSLSALICRVLSKHVSISLSLSLSPLCSGFPCARNGLPGSPNQQAKKGGCFSQSQKKKKKKFPPYRRLGITAQLALPMVLPLLLLVQLVVLVVVDFGFAVVGVLVCMQMGRFLARVLYLPASSVKPPEKERWEREGGGEGKGRGAEKKCKDERPPRSDSLSAARALVMCKGRVLIGVRRRSGEALERRAVLVRKDMVEDWCGGIRLSSPWNSMRQVEINVRQVIQRAPLSGGKCDVIELDALAPASVKKVGYMRKSLITRKWSSI